MDLKIITRLLFRILIFYDANDLLHKLFSEDTIIMKRLKSPGKNEKDQQDPPFEDICDFFQES